MLRKTSHIGLILLLLISTMGMTINLHFSQNKLYDAKFFASAESCCMPSKNPDNKHQAHNREGTIQHGSDCQDETIYIESVNDFVVSDTGFDFINASFINLFLYSVNSGYSLLNTTDTKYPELNIPPPEKQIVLSLLQSYLI